VTAENGKEEFRKGILAGREELLWREIKSTLIFWVEAEPGKCWIP